MRMRGIAAVGALSMGMLCAGAALAGEKGEARAAGDNAASKRVCRNIVVSGSHLSSRSCRTQASWDKEAERARRHVEELQTDFSAKDGAANTYGSQGGSVPR